MADAAHLVQQLNALLHSLHIPISIESPWELTPSLILAILESTLRKRLPIPQALRQARDLETKTRVMEIFLRCTEDLTENILGLQDVDPERLALGEWDEVVFVGEVLCQLASNHGHSVGANMQSPTWDKLTTHLMLDLRNLSLGEGHSYDPDTPSPSPVKSVRSPLTSRDITRAALSTKSLANNFATDASLSVVSRHTLPPEGEPFMRTDSSSDTPPSSGSRTPRCIHEVGKPRSTRKRARVSSATPDPLNDQEDDTSISSECPSGIFHPPKTTPVRRTGWIEPVDIDEELDSFEEARQHEPPPEVPARPTRVTPRSKPLSSTRTPPIAGTPRRLVTRHNSPSQHTLAILNERAKLTQELAGLRRPVAR